MPELRSRPFAPPPGFSYGLDTVQYFLIKLGIKPRLHLLEISIISLYHVIVRPTSRQKMGPFLENRVLQSFQKMPLIKVDLLI